MNIKLITPILILVATFCLIASCKKNRNCDNILNQAPPRRIDFTFTDKESGSNLILTDAFGEKNISVSVGETGIPFYDWRIIKGSENSPMNGFMEIIFFNDTPGDHSFKIQIQGKETIILSYTILKEKSEESCRLFSYPITGLKILNYSWDIYKQNGSIVPLVLVVKM
ncbi:MULTISPECIES: hypothetical protein [unclassified Sphingobacterium]|uniref:hypothetical protein n=1 Tax=unclassified Sphingobacterium TaxID=2609468 RepID=UPI00143A4BC0|nr:hypothetical protein [Sphingobacterium sp. B16(2022)]NJI72883.1 hypothetical protein [Sphingobacterium sp. B16(2022)]